MFILPGILFGNQLSTAYHALLLSYLAFWMVHASAVRVYGIALYLWFSVEMDRLDDLGEMRKSRFVGLRARFIPSLAALEWVQYWQCSLSNVGHRLSYD